MIAPDDSIVASLMFHSVGRERSGWVWRHLSEPLHSFEAKLALLARSGYTTAFWPDVYQHVAGCARLPPRTLMLTFDDGYLDNWVLVWPLLQRYRMRATVFVATDFIEADGPPRPTLLDVWEGRRGFDELRLDGFLRPSEMRAMAESGWVEIQSHAQTHTWHFTGDRPVDFYARAEYPRYPWLAWNARPERKPHWLSEDQAGFVPDGAPVFEWAPAMVARRFIPDSEALAAWERVRRQNPDIPPRALVARLGFEERWPGHFETPDERAERIHAELALSRERLAACTGRPVEFLCWPNGAYDDAAVAIARECGYLACTLGSRDARELRNRPGSDARLLKRIGTSNRLTVRGIDCGERDARYQLLRIRAHQRSLVHRALLAAYKLQAVAMAGLQGAADAR